MVDPFCGGDKKITRSSGQWGENQEFSDMVLVPMRELCSCAKITN